MKENGKKAAALSYDRSVDMTPKVTALGKGLIADEIIQRANEHDIPILEDPSLVELLANLNINEAIPSELYEAVAEVFAFIYQMDRKLS
ncbi:EscU/YscU/HrcU family type III secretion system export apparatus switch protein [Pseudogracilibacillus sp. SE30717A]|uniref:EscU/YscU/HrcU family type III secretion system export apparatus switch protein n=1 Tax=Pseudogracilibacillus sp. SE30717A TaxID=3098293 RepID=UPI00300DCA26